MGRSPSPIWNQLPSTVWLGFLFGVLASGISLVVVGPNLGFFFAGVMASALLVPALSLAESTLGLRLIVAAAITDGIAIVWLIALLLAPVTLVQWLLCYAILVGWCLALVGLAHAIERLARSALLASMIVPLGALMWLAWPVWLSGANAAILVSAHPLFALNGVLAHLGIWTERPLAYNHLMRLGQDFPYALPTGIAAAAGLHLLIGSIALLVGRVAGRS